MSDRPPLPPTDYRAYHRKTERNLAIAVVLALVGVGGALIAAVYGGGAMAVGLTCLLAGSGLFGVLWLALILMERWANRED